jgi:hypothetical protein
MRSLALVAALGFLVGCADSDDMTAPEPVSTLLEARKAEQPTVTRTYEVTVENLTSGGQHFTPPLVAIHRGSADFFSVGKEASSGIQQIAENGNLGPMLEGLEASKHVSSYTIAVSGEGLEGPLAPGEAVTVSLTGGPGFEFVSFASMLICTNDGFTGVDALMLPRNAGEEVHIYAGAYDAGTEINTEDFADLVPPCQILGGVAGEDAGTGASDPALWEGGVVRAHEGIMDRSDLVSSVHGWADPVAMFSVRRVG